MSLTKQEKEFLSDIRDAVSDWGYTYEYYHEDGEFCIDIEIEDLDEWGEDNDEIWDALSEVCDDWGAGLDSDIRNYYIAIDLDGDCDDDDDDDEEDEW